MAKVSTNSYTHKCGIKKRPGIHAKSKSSKMKQSKNYVKQYRGQGK